MIQALTNARLDVGQTRDLIRMCRVHIRQRGLDTPGLFRPFRIAEQQGRVELMIQLYLLSIDTSTYIAVFPILPENALDTLERNGTTGNNYAQQSKSKLASEELDKELRYASPHDIVSVLKWGLRHMRLRCSDFSSPDSDSWYINFVHAERASGYQARAIADYLHPQLPQPTAELLSETLDLMASVAAHSRSNHMPACTLCKVLGFWLLGRIGVAHPPPTFDGLKRAVDKATNRVEHLLLAHIRAQAAVTFTMPLRLTELVSHYPYIKQAGGVGLAPAFGCRPVQTLRVDLKSENIVVSQSKPRSVIGTLRDALEANASESIQGGKGELWAEVMLQNGNRGEEEGGIGLLIDEHVRILRKVDDTKEKVEGSNSSLVEAANAAALPAPAIIGATVSPAKIRASRRRSQSLSDLCSFLPPTNRPLFPLPESGTSTPTPKSSTPKRKLIPLSTGEQVEVVSDTPFLPTTTDLFSGGLEPFASWRSFSEEGFGIMSTTASSDLSLTELDLRPTIPTLPTRTSQRGLYRVRSSANNGSRRKTDFPLPPSSSSSTAGVEGESASGGMKKHTITSARVVEQDTAFSILWQDQLLDPSLCSSFPSLVFVQLNSSTTASLTTLLQNTEEENGEGKRRPLYPGESIWLLIVETIIPPRPPTPPDSGREVDSIAEKKSIFGSQSIKTVRIRLRRLSTVIGNRVSGTSRKVKELQESGGIAV